MSLHINVKLTARLATIFAGLLTLLAASIVLAASNAPDGNRTLIIVVGAVAMLVGAYSAWWVTRGLSARLQLSIASARRIAAGDLTGHVQVSGEDEISELQNALKELNDRLLKAISHVRNGTTTVAGTCSQVNRDFNILSRHTSSQANSLQQTAASMEELTATVKQNSDSAQQASELAVDASDRATKGGAVVGNAVRTMGSIEASSRKIADIVGVIDSIAFQTNILALNAAVEAARAGEQGRGFAVVAAEVRTLAQRSATAAKEIKSLIGDSVAQISEGSKLVAAAGKTMQEIVTSITDVAKIVNNISDASKEQSIGIESVNQSVTELDGMTGKNASLMKDASVTASSLNDKAVAVLNAVSWFNLGSKEYGTADECLALVRRAVAYAKEHGLQALLDDVSKLSNSRFVDRDMYLFVLDLDTANWIGHGNNPRAIGMGSETKDVVTGRYFVRDMAQLMKTQGAGWLDYHWQHPVTNEQQAKASYMERFGNVGIGCGIYKYGQNINYGQAAANSQESLAA